MVWKLAMEAQKTWRRLMGYQHITLVIEGRMRFFSSTDLDNISVVDIDGRCLTSRGG